MVVIYYMAARQKGVKINSLYSLFNIESLTLMLSKAYGVHQPSFSEVVAGVNRIGHAPMIVLGPVDIILEEIIPCLQYQTMSAFQ